MATYYAIGIGGTGAKCLEALSYLSACGMLGERELMSFFVDADKSNGNLNRASIALESYVKCRKSIERLREGNESSFVKTNLRLVPPERWMPCGETSDTTLGKFYNYSAMDIKNKSVAHLFQVLYTDQERETPLSYGFRGHPSIGAAIMAKTVTDTRAEPWRTLSAKIKQNISDGNETRILLFGSIFGGTGASGVPTIGRTIYNLAGKNNINKIKLGAVMLMPYFSFMLTDDLSDGLSAKSENFLINTQAALQYYYQIDNMKLFNSVYLIGDATQSQLPKVSLGGEDQKNAPHFIELYAAMGAANFFSESSVDNGYHFIARSNDNVIAWDDLPDGKRGSHVRNRIGQLVRFSVSYLSVYYPMLEYIRSGGSEYKAPWYIDFLKKSNIDIKSNDTNEKLSNIKTFCENFLTWLYSLHGWSDGEKIELLNKSIFNVKEKKENSAGETHYTLEYNLDSFEDLIFPVPDKDQSDLGTIWRAMCKKKLKKGQEHGLSYFIHALYNECDIGEGGNRG